MGVINKYHFFLKVILPLFGGIIIYYCKFNLSRSYGLFIPDWIKYNLPDGLWTFAFANCMFYIWKNSESKQKLIWFYVPVIFSIIFEFSQINLIPGTFDILDLVACIIGYIFSVLLYKYHLKSRVSLKSWIDRRNLLMFK
jgi:glycopeptide antibiotics resistance protein